jgi:hypothetical protein
MPDYTRQGSNGQGTNSATNGYSGYGNSGFPRAQPSQMSSYLGPNHGYGYQVGGATNGGSGNAYGGGAKHTRHQSTPVAPQLPAMAYNPEHSGFATYPQYPTRHQPSYPSSQVNMSPVEEADGPKDGGYPRRS